MLEACGAGGIGVGVEQVQQIVLVGIGFGHDAKDFLAEIRRARHLAARSAARHDEFADEFGSAQCDLLRHDAAQGPAE